MPRIPIDGPERLPRDYRKTLTVGLVLFGLFGPPVAYVYAIDRKLERHIAEVEALRPGMFEYVAEERAARCSTTRNVYKLCVAAGVECEPVEARCQTK